MGDRLKLAVVGVGRIGQFHARHGQELARKRSDCTLSAVVDGYEDTAERVATALRENQADPIQHFRSVEEALAADVVDAAVVASRTADHEAHTRALVEAGRRVLLEKPLADSYGAAAVMAAHFAARPGGAWAVMQAFQRRFDEPLRLARTLLHRGTIGRPFKVVSVLEDPEPPPDGYQSPGLLQDMSVHNIDEVIWLLGERPARVAALANRLHNVHVASVEEDFDDAELALWFPGGAYARIEVSRNHVAGYRNETWIYGEKGLVHVGSFQEDPLRVDVEALGRNEVLTRETFWMRDYGPEVPVFIERFGTAYYAELEHFVDRVARDEPFDVTHLDGLEALRVAEAGFSAVRVREDATGIA